MTKYFLIIMMVICHVMIAQEKKASIGFESVKFLKSPAHDSTEVFVEMKIMHPENIGSIELYYGTKKGDGDIAALRLQVVSENGDFYLVSGLKKFPVVQNIANIHASNVETAYLLKYDRFLQLIAKDSTGMEISSILKEDK